MVNLEADEANPVFGMNAVISINHLEDWFYTSFAADIKTALGVERKGDRHKPKADDFVEYVDQHSSNSVLIRDLANAVKHCKPVVNGNPIKGYGRGPYSGGPYGGPYLLIDKGENLQLAERYTDCLTLCKGVLAFWDGLHEIVCSHAKPQ